MRYGSMKKYGDDMSLSDQQIERELKRATFKSKQWGALFRTLSILLVLAAICVLVAYFWLPVFRVTGDSMEPTLEQGQILLAWRTQNLKPGDVAALYFENQILIKRVIGTGGDWIDIDKEGTVSVNGEPIDEDYLTDTVLGQTDLTYPYQVPEGCYFVMGDNRAESADSRISAIGPIAEEKIAGKILFCIWPMQQVEYFG